MQKCISEKVPENLQNVNPFHIFCDLISNNNNLSLVDSGRDKLSQRCEEEGSTSSLEEEEMGPLQPILAESFVHFDECANLPIKPFMLTAVQTDVSFQSFTQLITSNAV